MNRWALWIGLAGACAGLLGMRAEPRGLTVVIAGDVEGYVSPCGCTSPMSGGIRRWTTVVRRIAAQGPTVVLVNGGLVNGVGRQDQMKAEMLAEALSTVPIGAINVTHSEIALGKGGLLNAAELSGSHFLSGSLGPSSEMDMDEFRASGPLLIGSATGHPVSAFGLNFRREDEVCESLLRKAEDERLVPVLLYDGEAAGAQALARRFPALALIVCHQAGDPIAPVTVGTTVIVTPGEHGKSVVRIDLLDNRFVGYGSIPLGPEVPDDPEVTNIYKYYLHRVDQEDLLAGVDRHKTQGFSGSKQCGKCHQESLKVWQSSAHAHALPTLVKEGHGRDPDCVRCHVTGLESLGGFRSAQLTPDLSSVGCESCHGPGADHTRFPDVHRLPKIGPGTCLSCHQNENSPKFDFLTYWSRVKHF